MVPNQRLALRTLARTQQQHDPWRRAIRCATGTPIRAAWVIGCICPICAAGDYVVPLERIKPLAEQYPGRTWCLWNEPDMPTQDRTPPAEAVEHTRIWRELIGDNGRIAGYGINMQPTYDGGLRWLEGYLTLAANCQMRGTCISTPTMRHSGVTCTCNGRNGTPNTATCQRLSAKRAAT